MSKVIDAIQHRNFSVISFHRNILPVHQQNATKSRTVLTSDICAVWKFVQKSADVSVCSTSMDMFLISKRAK